MHTCLRKALVIVLAAAAAAILLLGSAWAAAPAVAELPAAPQSQAQPSLYVSPNERIGVGLVWGVADITTYDMTKLDAGWYADWAYRLNPPHPNGMDYQPLIPTGRGSYPPNWWWLAERILKNRGHLWIVGNEPEAPFMENYTPAQYATIYHDVYHFIKNIDPTAQVTIGGVIQPSPLRLQWLDMLWAEYQARYGAPLPLDWMNTHMQILNEVSCSYDPGNCWGAEIPAGITANYGITMTLAGNASYDIFVDLLWDLRHWMNARGLRDKPLLISEYGVLLPSEYLCDSCGENPALGDAIVASFMTRTFEFMLNTVDPTIGMPADGNRLVQRWMWYTLNDRPYDFETGTGFNGALFDYRDTTYPGTLTYFGRVFGDFVKPLKVPYVDLKPSDLVVGARTGDVITLTAKIDNIGNTPTSAITVRLYDGVPTAGGQPVDADVVIPSVGIRYAPPGLASFVFHAPSDLKSKTFYVVVDPDNAIVESNETNNSASFFVRLRDYEQRIHLPVITRNYTFSR